MCEACPEMINHNEPKSAETGAAVFPVTLVIDVSEPIGGDWDARWATVKLNGITLFRDMVYDTDPAGNRTAEQAARNLLLVLQSRARRYLED